MKGKIFSLGMFAVFAALFVTAFASAALELTPVSVPSTVQHDAGSAVLQFNLVNTDTTNAVSGLSWSDSAVTSPTGAAWAVLPTITQINAGQTVQVSAVLSFPKHSTGNILSTLIVKSGALQASNNINIQVQNSNAFTLTKTKDITRSQDGQIKLENTGNTQLGNIVLTQSGALEAVFSDNNFPLNPSAIKTVTLSTTDLTGLKFGDNALNIVARDSTTSTERTVQVNFINGFCKAGQVGGNLSIRNVDINSDGDEDDEWKPLDTIEIEVEVENNGADDISDVFVELGLFDTQGRNMISDLDFENSDEEEFDMGRIRDGDEETITFTFQVPADFETGDYKLAVKAYSDDLKEEVECTDTSSDLNNNFYQTIDVIREDDEGKFIAFDNFIVSPEQATCGDSVALTVDVYNIGDEDQDQVRVNLFNSELGIRQSLEIRNDLDEGDKERVTFNFQIPQGMQNKLYQLELSADYDFRNDVYRESSDSSTKRTLNVIGCTDSGSGTTDRIALITATLASEAKAGESLVVNARITNPGTSQAILVVDATGHNSWATIGSISERLITLGAGESREVVFTFNVDKEASGSNSFNIEVRSGEKIETREVEVNIKSTQSPGFGFNLGEGNTLIWVIGAINVILIVLIIVVAVRISRR